jgi:hypothetical protein
MPRLLGADRPALPSAALVLPAPSTVDPQPATSASVTATMAPPDGVIRID